ncbi:MAG: glycosyltransferase [Thermodesulfobacteriota bacterium]
MNPRILTFNWHESYIHLLAKTGYPFDVVEKWKGGRFGWITEFRPLPDNCRLISEEEATDGLKRGLYSNVIAHNLQDLLFTVEYRVPVVLIFHNKLSTEIALGGNTIDRAEYVAQVCRLCDAMDLLTLVFISQAKRADWGLEGELILPGIDGNDYGGWRGDIARVLRVGNLLKERDLMMGYSIQERILQGRPSTTLGLNPTLADSIMPESWEELKERFRSHRLYLNTTVAPAEDGYNLAMLEAMATGTPVVSIANPTSPLIDGKNGIVSKDEGHLREQIEMLFEDRQQALDIGKRGREAVLDIFPIKRFTERWREVLGGNIISASRGHNLQPPAQESSDGGGKATKWKILLSYTSNPQTTAAYMERALRKKHDVKSYGPRISDDTLKKWDLEKIRARVADHDIPYSTPHIGTIIDGLAPEWRPDLFLWIETGVWFPMEGFRELPCPSACYLIDTHLNLAGHLELARNFDYIFLAHRQYIPDFHEAGFKNVYWLPVACDPLIHGRGQRRRGKGEEGDKLYDISFVGSLNQERRVKLLDRIRERYNLHYERCFLERMAEVFGQSRIVFNNAVKNDLNMRVFEVMAAGSMLLTDEAPGSGLDEFFKDREHLVIYNDENVLELIDYYLKNPQKLEEIAMRGESEALAHHTYDHRVDEMLASIDKRSEDTEGTVQSVISGSSDVESDYYRQDRRDVELLIPEGARRILDVGCGEGVLGKRLLERGAVEVVGVEMTSRAAERAEKNLSRVLCGNIEDMDLPFDDGYFDSIIMADVLEHLQDPLGALMKVKERLAPGGVLAVSVPNVRYYGVMDMLAEGRWKYADSGILDRDHLRFFTFREISDLLTEAGFEITGVTRNLDPRYNDLSPNADTLSFGRVTLKNLKPQELRDLFVTQYLIRGEKRVSVQVEDDSTSEKSDAMEEVESALAEHLKLHPADTGTLYRHAELCSTMGLAEKGMVDLERLSFLAPDKKGLAELRERLLDGVGIGEGVNKERAGVASNQPCKESLLQGSIDLFSREHIIELYTQYGEEISSDPIMEIKRDVHGNHDGGLSRVDGELVYMLIRKYAPKHVIEFSPNEGYSTAFLYKALEKNGGDASFATFDLETLPSFPDRMKSVGIAPELIVGDALVTIPRYIHEHSLEGKIDFCFIDSDHSYSFAREYTEKLFPLMSRECIYVIHDMSYRPDGGSPFSHYGPIAGQEIIGTAYARGEGNYLSEFFSNTSRYTVFSTHRLFGDCHEGSSDLPRNLELIEVLSEKVAGFELPKSAGMAGGMPRPPMSLIIVPTHLLA